MNYMAAPGLFGLNNSNRDFTKADAWGKNQFNTSFPVALVCYMASRGIEPVYLQLDSNLKIVHGFIALSLLLGNRQRSSGVVGQSGCSGASGECYQNYPECWD
jgi:hypothetical protein